GEVADLVKVTVEQELGTKVTLDIQHIKDIRNYKVSIERARNVLGFHPQHNVKSIVRQLIRNMSRFTDWDNPKYYNIEVFKSLESSASSISLRAAEAETGR
ncbi:MAG TPA: hypothetical protein VE825_04920, partial [Terriglobales bacterium]|nr:hypothetical protein [Terriglobales bacterium]